jgi:hypothetical protein
MGPESESRPVTLFYVDPDDAIQMHEEMKQMTNMGNADIRITVTTLAKAIRQSSNLGGLVTGSPIEPEHGQLKSTSEGGSLRYKIVPPKRQLFYAARCRGKEEMPRRKPIPLWRVVNLFTMSIWKGDVKRRREGAIQVSHELN